MIKVFRFFTFSLWLTFLLLLESGMRRTFKAAFLMVSYSALMYATFIVCIQSPRSNFGQINDDYGREEAVLDMEQQRLYSIIFKAGRLSNPNMITIVPTATLEAERKRDSITAARSISLDDRFFLLEILSRLKKSSLKTKTTIQP